MAWLSISNRLYDHAKMPDNPQPSSLTTALYAAAAFANFLAIPVSALLGYLFGKKKQSADILHVNAETHRTDAETHKTEAETRQIDSTIALKAFERLDELECIIADLRVERREDKRRLDDWEMKYGLLEVQMRKAVATFKSNNIPWDEKASP